MDKKERKAKMFIPTVMMGLLALLFALIAYSQGRHMTGFQVTLDMTRELLPLLVFAFIMAGMIQVIFPKEILSQWIGTESGIKGIVIGTLAGAFAPGGPYVSMPIAAGLLRSGASIGTMVAFLTGWSLWAVSRLPMEVGIMGWRFTVIRLLSVFFFPPIAGLIAQMLVKMIK